MFDTQGGPARLVRLTALGLFLTALVGCGGKLQPVRGKVVFKDGSPLKGGLVTFEPLDPADAKYGARGEIDSNGTFQLSTHTPGDGVSLGKHRAAVTPPLPDRVTDLGKGPRLFDQRFEQFDTSKLEFTVERGDNNFTIVVEKPPPEARSGR